MGIEIEHKYLIKDDSWRSSAGTGLVCKQGYLVANRTKTVRVRVIGAKAYLTVKGATIGISRPEYEYEIPVADAEAMLALCESRIIEKTRYYIDHAGMLWEVDVFAGKNHGLIIAEVELESEDQLFERPSWVGEEVSEDVRYYNAYLAFHPFSTW